MIDAKVLNGVCVLLHTHGRLTCGVLAGKMNMPPSAMVYFLRDAVDAGVLTERNGFYDVPRPRPEVSAGRHVTAKPAAEDVNWCTYRRSLSWVEGNAIPALAKEFATGVLTCETVHIVAEVDDALCQQGCPALCWHILTFIRGFLLITTVHGISPTTSCAISFLIIHRFRQKHRKSASMIKSIGFVLLVGTCGNDACDAIPVTEKIWPTEQACMQVMERIQKHYPNEIFYCEEVLRNENTDDY